MREKKRRQLHSVDIVHNAELRWLHTENPLARHCKVEFVPTPAAWTSFKSQRWRRQKYARILRIPCWSHARPWPTSRWPLRSAVPTSRLSLAVCCDEQLQVFASLRRCEVQGSLRREYDTGAALLMFEALKDLWGFALERRKLWLIPFIATLLLLSALVAVSQYSAVAPFIYTLF